MIIIYDNQVTQLIVGIIKFLISHTEPHHTLSSDISRNKATVLVSYNKHPLDNVSLKCTTLTFTTAIGRLIL